MTLHPVVACIALPLVLQAGPRPAESAPGVQGTPSGQAPAPAAPAVPAAAAGPTAPSAPAAPAAPAAPGARDGGIQAELEASAKTMLAESWLRESYLILATPDVVPENIAAAMDLGLSALELTPDRVDGWRLVLGLAQVAEPGFPGARDVARQAVKRIVKLDPEDQVARLLRISDTIDEMPTAEARVDAYRRFLAPEVVPQIGSTVAARLAFDLALLLNRMGDVDGFSRTLGQAVALDPAFPAATEMAAGFFQARVNDPAASAELLIAAVVANPANVRAYSALGSLLMQEGAYDGAARVYRLGLLAANGSHSNSAIDGMTADLALALWGQGNVKDAITLVSKRVAAVDLDFRGRVQQANKNMSLAEAQKRLAPLDPLLATVNAVLLRTSNASNADDAVARMGLAFRLELERQTKMGDATAESSAGLALNNAFVTLMLAKDVSSIPKMVETAEQILPLSDEAKNRFAGWHRLRSGEAAGAVEVLSPLAAGDVMARLGLGLALVETGRRQEGARELLAVANSERGTMLGLYAADRLAELVGARPGATPVGARMEQVLADLPSGFDRFCENAERALAVQVVPVKSTLEAFQPVRFRITVTNRSELTLALDPQGPIDTRAAFSPTISLVGQHGGALSPTVLPIDRRLELAPGETMSFELDASLYELGAILSAAPLGGCNLTMRVVINFIPSQPRVLVGFIGREVTSEMVRVNGVRTDDAWVESAWAAIKEPDSQQDLVTMALLGHWLVSKEDLNDRPLVLELSQQWSRFAESFRKLPPLAQAWLLMELPGGSEAIKPLLEVAKESTDGRVAVSYLLKRVDNPRDAMLDVARRSGDARLGRLADSVQASIERRRAAKQREFGLEETAPPAP